MLTRSTVQGSTPDGFSFVGNIPGRADQYIMAGFNGAGMVYIFLSSQGLAHMIINDIPFEQTGLPRILQPTTERLKKKATSVN